MDIWTAALPAFAALTVSLAGCLVIVSTRGQHLHKTARRSLVGSVQTMHADPAPQIGGLALIAGLVAGLLVLRHNPTSDSEAARLVLIALVAGFPILLTGMMEDVGKGARPALRLFAALAASALAMELTETRLLHGGFPGGDALLAFTPFAVAFTIFATAGATHAFNLVDGVHGFAIGTAMVIAGALAAIAGWAGDALMLAVALLTTAALLGVLVFNFPRGHVFLGDTGAYGIGHFLSWTAIILLWRNPEVSPWAMLLVFFWPILETLFSMGRRIVTRRPFGQPDKLHFHHIVLRLIESRWIGRSRRHVVNPLTAVVLLPVVALIAGLGVWAMTSTALAFLLLGTVSVAYALAYVGLHRIQRSKPGSAALGRAGLASRGSRRGGPAHGRRRLDANADRTLASGVPDAPADQRCAETDTPDRDRIAAE